MGIAMSDDTGSWTSEGTESLERNSDGIESRQLSSSSDECGG